jgi:hypothetical protein
VLLDRLLLVAHGLKVTAAEQASVDDLRRGGVEW